MSGCDNSAGFALPEDGIQPGDLCWRRSHEVAEDISRADGRQLVRVANE